MSIFETLGRMQWETFRTVVGEDVLDVRAINFLLQEPDVTAALLTLREVGRCDLDLRMVQHLCKLGVMTADRHGYFLTEAVEDLLDFILKEMEKEDSDKSV